MIQTKIFYPRQLLLIRSEIELKEIEKEATYIYTQPTTKMLLFSLSNARHVTLKPI